MDSFTFFVPGEPITEGSMRTFKSGQRTVVTHDRGPELDAWRIKVRRAAEAAAEAVYWEPRYDGPVEVWAEFRLPRPKSVPPSKRPLPFVKPDLDKLQRAVGDALAPYKQHGVLRDDSRIVGWSAVKLYADDAHPAGVMVRVSKAQDHLTGQFLTTVNDVADAPAGAAVLDAYDTVFVRGYGDWVTPANEYGYADHEIDLPARLAVVDGI